MQGRESVAPAELMQHARELMHEPEGWAFAAQLYGKRAMDDIDLRFVACQALAQKKAGMTGGGPECPMCGERNLRMLEDERAKGAPIRFQCGNEKCSYGVTMRVDGRNGRLVVEAIARN